MMKKLLLRGMILCLLVCLFAVGVHAESGSCGNGVSWSLENGVLTISGSGEMTDYEEIDAVPWREMRENITEVIVEPGVTHLGKWCFYDLDSVESVVLPGTLKTIGTACFRECAALVELVLPEGLEEIGYMSISCCNALTYLTIPSTLTEVDDEVFTQLPELLWVDIDYYNPRFIFQDDLIIDIVTNTLISGSATVGKVKIPEGIECIAEDAFMCNPYITGVVIPETVREIESMSFYRCEDLTEVYMPASLTSFGMYVFEHSENLTSINYAGTSAQWQAIDFLDPDEEGRRVLEKTMNYGVPVPAVDTYVGQSDAVQGNVGGQTTVETTEEDAWNSYDLDSGSCGDGLEWTLTSWQEGEESGTFLSIMGSGDMWDYSPDAPAPWSGYGYDQISVWEGVTSIGDYAFYRDMSMLDSVFLPASVTSFGEGCFEGNPYLEVIFYEGTLEQWERAAVESGNDTLLANLCYYVPEEDTYYPLENGSGPAVDQPQETDALQATATPGVSENTVVTEQEEESETSPMMILIIVALAVLVIAIGTSTAVIITVLKKNKQNQNVSYAPPPPVNGQTYAPPYDQSTQQYGQYTQQYDPNYGRNTRQYDPDSTTVSYDPYSQYRQDQE